MSSTTWRSGHVRYVLVDQAVMLDVFQMLWLRGESPPPEFRLPPPFPPLPPGCKLLGVRELWDRRQFAFLVENPSFEEVPDGNVIPYWTQEEAEKVAHPKMVVVFDEAESLPNESWERLTQMFPPAAVLAHDTPSTRVQVLRPQKGFISQKELDRLAGQKCPITKNGKVVGEATMRADGTADMVMSASISEDRGTITEVAMLGEVKTISYPEKGFANRQPMKHDPVLAASLDNLAKVRPSDLLPDHPDGYRGLAPWWNTQPCPTPRKGGPSHHEMVGDGLGCRNCPAQHPVIAARGVWERLERKRAAGESPGADFTEDFAMGVVNGTPDFDTFEHRQERLKQLEEGRRNRSVLKFSAEAPAPATQDAADEPIIRTSPPLPPVELR
jgi:hypothetical protein